MVQIVQTRDVSVGRRGCVRVWMGWDGEGGREGGGRLTVVEVGDVGVKEYT